VTEGTELVMHNRSQMSIKVEAEQTDSQSVAFINSTRNHFDGKPYLKFSIQLYYPLTG